MLFLYLGIYLFPFTTYFIFEKFRLTLNLKKKFTEGSFQINQHQLLEFCFMANLD